RQPKGSEYRIKLGISSSPAVVELDYIFQAFQAAVVHVGTGEGNAAQCWCLEFAAVVIVLGDGKSTLVFLVPADSRVVELLVGEIGSTVAAPAAAFAFVKPQAVAFGGRERSVVAIAAEAVHCAVAAQQHALKPRDSLAQICCRHTVGKCFVKLRLVLLVV